MSVDIHGLNIAVGGRLIVSDVDLAIADGERVGLIGSSGSGKSMISKAILGLLPLTAAADGSIDMSGTEIIGASEHVLADLRGRYVGAVFQNPAASLNPVMTVAQQISLPLKLHYDLTKAERADRVNAMLDKVGLDRDMAGKYPHELSGGQQQRVVIARAIINEPKVILADEPMSAIDVAARIQILDTFAAIRETRRETALIMVSHDLGVVQHIADRILVLHDGRVEEEGSTAEVLGSPQSDYTRQLIEAASL